MIKQIQLRGISRAPSDRMTEDGGVAESLNMYLDNGELAPINTPRPCEEDFGITEETTRAYEPIYIHKMQSKEILIAIYWPSCELYYLVDGIYTTLISLGAGNVPEQIKHIGNTLIMQTSKGLIYMLYRNGEYINIDFSEDTLPKLSFVNKDVPARDLGNEYYSCCNNTRYDSEYAIYINGDPSANYKVTNADDKAILQKMWDTYRQIVDTNLAAGAFVEPVMVRYAIRLYDGSYLWASSPIMLGSSLPKQETVGEFTGFNDFSSPVLAYTEADSNNEDAFTRIITANPYKVGVRFFRTDRLEELKDLIASVDVFLSAPINMFPDGDNCVRGEFWTDKVTATGRWQSCYRYFFDPANSEDSQKIEDSVLQASTFFLAKSYPVDDIPEDLDVLNGDFRGESLFVKTRLDDNKVVQTMQNAGQIFTYNNRLFVARAEETFSRGIGVLNGQHANRYEENDPDYDYTAFSYAFAYHIPELGKVIKDYSAKSVSRTDKMTPDMGYGMLNYNDVAEFKCVPYAWISHPNPNCTKVSVIIYSEGVAIWGYDLDMKPHPYLNCSYAFLGFGVRVARVTSTSPDEELFDSYDDTPSETHDNKIVVSNSDNPFVYATSGEITTDSKVLDMVVAASPLSIGQFGQFPLYLFQENGVYAMSITSDGRVGSRPDLVTAEVCINVDTIMPVADSVYFMTSRGLLNIRGGAVTNVSEYMNGQPFVYGSTVVSIIEGTEHAPYIEENSYFHEFMANPAVRCAFDYEGNRLIYFNPSINSQYVYCIKSQTWHRTMYGSDSGRLNRVLNTFPKCIVTTWDTVRVGGIMMNKYGLLDLSTLYDLQNATSEKGVIVTRPFDLGHPDVLKSISDIRIRGQFAKGAVKFILLGSNDGINFYTISTLRGKSWKLFRIIILADLSPTERISWIDVNYELRFNNKLR